MITFDSGPVCDATTCTSHTATVGETETMVIYRDKTGTYFCKTGLIGLGTAPRYEDCTRIDEPINQSWLKRFWNWLTRH